MSSAGSNGNGPTHSEEQAALLIKMLTPMRKDQCLSQAQVAAKLGSSRSHIAAIEQGKVMPRLDTFLKLLSMYGYEISIEKQREKEQRP